MRWQVVVGAVVWLAFSAFSTFVVLEHGYFGFLAVAADSDWGLQVFLDLCIALTLSLQFLGKRAKDEGRNRWPWVLLTLTLGSIGALAWWIWMYLVPAETTG